MRGDSAPDSAHPPLSGGQPGLITAPGRFGRPLRPLDIRAAFWYGALGREIGGSHPPGLCDGRRDAARKGNQVQPATLRFAEYVIVFTTFPEPPFSAADVLEWYRLRWQVELVFKRFKSLAQLGHVPKYDDDSAKAWLYGKLFVALLVEKLIHRWP